MASPRTRIRSGRILRIAAERRLRRGSRVAASALERSIEPRAARRRRRPPQAPATGASRPVPTSCLPPLLSCTRGSESEPTVTAPVHSNMPFTPCAWTPVSQREVLIDRQPGSARRIADRKVRQPSAAAHPQQVVGVGRQRVGTNREQVLIGERLADQEVAAAIRGARHGAERRRNAAGLQVEAAVRPRADADEQPVRRRTTSP